MEIGLWVLLACIAGVAPAIVWWKRRARRAFTLNHFRVELHDARVVDDRIVDAVWRAPISMTNESRRPRGLPVLAERATVRAGRRVYLATVYLDADVAELNPGDSAIAWVEFILPDDARPRSIELVRLRAEQRSVKLRYVTPATTSLARLRPVP